MANFLVYDVFTDARYGGNPLAILPDAREIPEDELQKIAREFNFSETVFLYPPEHDGSTAKVRMFTPTAEVPFAGHPTIGTAVMLAEAGLGPDLLLELGIGPITAHAAHGQAQFTTGAELEIVAEPDKDLVARCLGTTRDKIVAQPVMASLGLAFTFTQIADRETLAALEPDTEAMREGADRHPSGLGFAQCAWVDDGDTLHVRMFAPLDGVPEDPATGSAAAALAALRCKQTGGPVRYTIHQGDDMGRPSVIGVTGEPGQVTVAGQAVRVMEGTLVR